MAIKEISDTLRNLTTNLNNVRDHLALLTPPTAPVQNPASYLAPSSLPPHRESFVPPSEHYRGDCGSCWAFLVKCSLVFEQQPHTSDPSCIAYLINPLKGAALAWASALWEKQMAICFSYADFTQEKRKVFDHPIRGKSSSSPSTRVPVALLKWPSSSGHSLQRAAGMTRPFKVRFKFL